LRLALRELRGGLRGFYVFIACIALGVLAIAAVGSFAHSLADGLARQGRVILGGDEAFSLIQREAIPAERAFLASQGRRIRGRGHHARDGAHRGTGRPGTGGGSRPSMPPIRCSAPSSPSPPAIVTRLCWQRRDGNAFGALADPALLTRLDLKTGCARDCSARRPFELRAVLAERARQARRRHRLRPAPADQRGRACAPPACCSRAAWCDGHYRLRLPAGASSDTDAQAVVDAANAELPEAGWEIRSRGNATPQLDRNIERFSQYLTLVGLTALLVGGVGVANSAKHYLDRKRSVIATLKSLGATGTRVVAVYLVEVLLLAGIGIVIGLAIGAVLPFAVASMFGAVIPLPLAPALYPGQLALALAYGVLTATTFALWPLGRAHDLPVSALFRDEIAPERRLPRLRYLVATAVAAAALAALAVAAAYDRKIAIIFIASALLVFGLLRLIASLVMLIARSVPRPRSTVLRLAVSNIFRPGALTPTVVISLGLGLALLVTVLEVDANLRQQFAAALPEKAPSFYFLDIPAGDVGRFDDFVRTQAPRATLVRVPMLRGRIVSARGTKAEDLDPKPDAAWVLQSDRGITYTSELPAGSRLTDGEWWGKAYSGPNLVSFEKKIAEGLGLKIGDDVTVNVLGRNMTARIANLRTVDWQSLGINFVMVFSPGTFAGAPVTDIATVTFPGGGTNAEETALMKAVTDNFPGVTAVRVKEALDAVGAIVTNLVLGVRAASAITLIAAVLVLGGALAAGHRHRVYDAVILKTFGATRRQLMTAYAIEYLLLGGATVVFGVAAGSIAGWGVVVNFMALPFHWQVGPAIAAAVAAVLLTLAFGLIGTWPALGRKPAPVLRNL
jgi:putative ABC transport system permease protein